MALTIKEVEVSSFRAMVRSRWPKLSSDELHAAEVEPESLVELVQERYKLDGDEADRQVYEFEVANCLPDLSSLKLKSKSYA